MSGNILVLRLSALGDVVHTMPAVVALRRALPPGVRLGWVVEQPYAELVRLVAPVDEVFATATKRWRRNALAAETRSEVQQLRERLRRFAEGGTAVDYQGLLKSAVIGRLSGAGRRIGFAAGAIREKAAALVNNERVAVDTSRHVIEWNLALSHAAGARDGVPPAVDYSRFPLDEGGRLEEAVVEAPVVVVPGAGHASKRWHPSYFRHFTEEVRRRLGLISLAVWGPGEIALARAITDGNDAARLAPATDLRGLAFVLKRARIVIGGDTGPLHLAAALGTSVVGLYGPTNFRRNGPWGQIENCVESYSSTRDIDSISTGEVVSKTEEIVTR